MARAISAFAIASGTADAAISPAHRDLRYHGFSAAENAGTPAVASFIIRNGVAATDPLVEPVSLGASVSRSQYYQDGISCPNGLFLDRVAGTTIVVVFMSNGD